MSKSSQDLMHNCLYFTANSMARTITRMAEEAFRPIGLSPSHAFVMMLTIENPGCSPSELSTYLSLAPSTVTRLVDWLDNRGFVERKSEGKNMVISATESGKKLAVPIASSWKSLHTAYSAVLGEAQGDDLAEKIDKAAALLKKR